MNEEQGNQGSTLGQPTGAITSGTGDIAAAVARTQTNQKQDDDEDDTTKPVVTWSAADSVTRDHSKGWYLAITGALIAIYVLVGILVFFFKMALFGAISAVFLATVVYAAIIILARHPANEIHYELSEAGIKIEDTLKSFAEYRAFGVQQLGSLWRIVLIPTKRFGIQDSIFIPEDKGETIVDFIGAHLPIEEVREDPTEKILNLIKF